MVKFAKFWVLEILFRLCQLENIKSRHFTSFTFYYRPVIVLSWETDCFYNLKLGKNTIDQSSLFSDFLLKLNIFRTPRLENSYNFDKISSKSKLYNRSCIGWFNYPNDIQWRCWNTLSLPDTREILNFKAKLWIFRTGFIIQGASLEWLYCLHFWVKDHCYLQKFYNLKWFLVRIGRIRFGLDLVGNMFSSEKSGGLDAQLDPISLLKNPIPGTGHHSLNP